MLRGGMRSLRSLSVASLVSWGSGYALGALTGIYPWPSVIAFGSVTLFFGVIALRNSFRAFQIRDLTPWELSLRDPDNDAAAAVTRSNEHHLVVGQAIETIPHPQLNSRAALEDLGWEPADVDVTDRQSAFDAGELASRAGGVKDWDPPNGIKFSLVATSFVTSDSPRLSLDTERTDYFTLRSLLPLVGANPAVRAVFGHLDPSRSRIPHSLCLHYIVRFSTGDVLCMQRDPRADYHGNLWSFSGEEQLAERDFEAAQPCLSLFQRTFCEEVLALRDETPLEERWRVASEAVRTMRLWSVFIEERIHNYSLLGLFQLTCDPAEFVTLHNQLVDRGIGTRDREGDCYLVKDIELLGLLVDGRCTARALFHGAEADVRAENLHPTSRYRVFRLLRAVKRRPLELGDYEAA